MNRYLTDPIIGRPIKRQRFRYQDTPHCKNTNLLTNEEWFTKLTYKGWEKVPATIDLELAFETRQSRRLI